MKICLAMFAMLVLGCQAPAPSQAPAPKEAPVASQEVSLLATPATSTDLDSNAVNFCVAAMSHALACANDPVFWDHVMTMYFALDQKAPNVDPEMKQAAIDVMKGDFKHLRDQGEPRSNCEVSVRHLKLPTTAQVERILKAIPLSCGEYGSALGWLIFGEGVFHVER